MGKQSAMQAYQRGKNAGGVAPDPYATLITLAILFKRCRRRSLKSDFNMETYSDVELLVVLYLWLTQQLATLTSADDIPDLNKISGSQPCQPHCLRNIKDGGVSWTEFALAYQHKGKTIHLWQPMPALFNALFQPFVSSKAYNSPWLSKKQKQTLFAKLQKKWKTPKRFKNLPRQRKDTFFHYFTTMTQVDPILSTLAKSVLLTAHQLHHQSAKAYQRENTDQLRFKIFKAHNLYLTRLTTAAREHDLSHELECKINGTTISLIQSSSQRPPYLTKIGMIPEFHIDTRNGNKQIVQTEPLLIGSARSLDTDDVSLFFKQLNAHVLHDKPEQKASLNALKIYYNLRTYQLALQFIVLTGTRPTHAITLEKHRHFGSNATVKDKGRLRPIWLCDYLQRQIADYLSLQARLLSHLPTPIDCPVLWHLLDEHDQVELLNAKKLRRFMAKLWPGQPAVPYQLRHFFAQCALTSTQPQLATHHIDRLMGHSQFGEHLGSDHLFPTSLSRIRTHLNKLPALLHLT